MAPQDHSASNSADQATPGHRESDHDALEESLSEDNIAVARHLEFLTAFRECPQVLLNAAKQALKDSSDGMAVSTAPAVLSTGMSPEEEFTRARELLQLRVDDILNYPDQYLSEELRQHRERIREALDDLDPSNAAWEGVDDDARPAATRLESEVRAAVRPLRAHDQHVRQYYRLLKIMRNDIEWADTLSNTSSDPGGEASRQFRAVRQQVITAAGANDYQTACAVLRELKVAVTALADQRIAELIPHIDAARSSSDAVEVVNRLQPMEIAALPPEKQLLLLQKLRWLIQCGKCHQWHGSLELKDNNWKCLNAECSGEKTDMEIRSRCKQCRKEWTTDPCELPCGTVLQHHFLCFDCERGLTIIAATENPVCPCCGPRSSRDRYHEYWLCPACQRRFDKPQPNHICGRICNATDNEEPAESVGSRNERLYEEAMIARAKVFCHMDLIPEFQEFVRQRTQQFVRHLRSDPQAAEALRQFDQHWRSLTFMPDADSFLCQKGCGFLCDPSDWESHGRKCPQCGNAEDRPLSGRAHLERITGVLITAHCQALGHTWDWDLSDSAPITRRDPLNANRKLTFDRTTGPVQAVFGRLKGSIGKYDTSDYPSFILLDTTTFFGSPRDEMLNTLIHENLHAYDASLRRKLTATPPYDGNDPQTGLSWPETLSQPENRHLLMQAKLFRENQETYIRTATLQSTPELRTLSQMAYIHQPTEAHAREGARLVEHLLTTPPPIQSFNTRHRLRNKMWIVTFLTRNRGAELRTKEPHGICNDKKNDSTFILETQQGTWNVKIDSVRNPTTVWLTTDFDGTVLKPEVIACDGQIIDSDQFENYISADRRDRIRAIIETKWSDIPDQDLAFLKQTYAYYDITEGPTHLRITSRLMADVRTARLYLNESVPDIS